MIGFTVRNFDLHFLTVAVRVASVMSLSFLALVTTVFKNQDVAFEISFLCVNVKNGK